MDLPGKGNKHDLLSKFGAWGEGKVGREHKGLGWLSCWKDREGQQGKSYLDKAIHYGIREKPGTREIPRNLQGRPQQRIKALVERVPDLYNQIDDYLSCCYPVIDGSSCRDP